MANITKVIWIAYAQVVGVAYLRSCLLRMLKCGRFAVSGR